MDEAGIEDLEYKCSALHFLTTPDKVEGGFSWLISHIYSMTHRNYEYC